MGLYKNGKSQVAIDFLISYGIAMLIMGVAIVIIYQLGILNPLLTPVQCASSPGFGCGFFYINSTGALTLSLAQNIGSQIAINGVACSNMYNASGDRPQFGNIFVTSNSVYYPAGHDPAGSIVYSSSNITITLYCYTGGGVADGGVGNLYFGHVWLNFSIPGYKSVTESVATVTAKYA